MSTKILFTFEAEDLGVAKKQDEISDRLKQIRREIEAAKKAGSPYDALLKETQALKREQTELRKRQRELNNEFKATKVPKDSIAGLRLEYSRLISQIENLDLAQRNSTFGEKLISQAAAAKQKINEMEAEVGRFTGNVGNYKAALTNLGDFFTGGLVTGGVVAGVAALTKVMQVGISASIEYEKALSDLSALTGLRGDELKELDNVARGLQVIQIEGQQIVKQGPEILNALKLVGGARPELLKDAAALGEVTRQAIVLSQAAGDDLETSVRSLTTLMGQFNLTANDTDRVINELAAGAKEGAAEIPDITEALTKAGAVANIYNVTTAESIALVELLADKQLKGAEAGTQLRNVFVKLASADALPRLAREEFNRLGISVDVLKDTTLPLETRLREIGKAQGDLTALTKIFGVENLQAAAIITSGIPKYVALTEAVQGTNEAYLQAEVRSDNLATKLDNLSNKALNRLEEKFTSGTGAASGLVSALDFLVDKLDIVGVAFDAVEIAVLGPLSGFQKFADQIKSIFGAGPDGEQGAFFDIDPSQFKDDTDKILNQVELLKAGLTDDEPPKTLSELKAQLKSLKEILAKTPVRTTAFSELSKEIKETERLIKELEGRVRPGKESAVAGSIGFYEEAVRKLRTELEKTPVQSPAIAGLIKQLDEAERKLKFAKEQLEEIRSPKKNISEVEQAEAGLAQLGVKVDTKANEDRAAAELENLAVRLAASVGIEIPLNVDTSGAEFKLQELELEIQRKNEAAEAKEKERQASIRKAGEQAAIESAQNIANAAFQVRAAELERYQKLQFQKLDEDEKKALDAAQGNAAKQEQIRKEYEKKRAALEKEGAKKRKELSRKEALINTALAITKALTGAPPPFSFILAGVAAIAGAAQLSVINAQEFWQGGKVKPKRLGSGIVRERQNAPRTAHGDTVLAYLKPGEMVLNEGQQQSVKAMAGRNIFRRAGVPGTASSTPVPHFATGGVVGDLAPQTISYAQQPGSGGGVTATFTDEQAVVIGRILAAQIAPAVGDTVREGIGVGLNDANRRMEREAALEQNRLG